MSEAAPKFPEVEVRLVGEDGNAFAVLGRCQRAALEAGVERAEVGAFFREATSGDYAHLLATVSRWWTVLE